MPLTLVTGASGHIGNNLIRALLERGERVRALVRTTETPDALRGLDVEIARGDLRDEASLDAAMRGCNKLFHVAAMISIRNGDRAALWDTNVLGTRRLMRTAARRGVERVVHTSSFGAIGQNHHGASNEEGFLDPFESVMDYERSKASAELEVMREALRGLDVVIVNPTATVGPFDFRPSLVGKTIVEFGQGKMKAYVPGAFDWVAMRDVVEGHLLAMEHGKRGERYLLSGEQHALDEILQWLSEDTGRPVPKLKISPNLMQGVAVFKDWVERRFFPKKYPRFNYHSIRLLTCGKYGDNSRAQQELGLKSTSVREAFRGAVQWFQRAGYF